MITDYSEVTATLNSKLSILNGLMNEKKWDEASEKLTEIADDLLRLHSWLQSVNNSDLKA